MYLSAACVHSLPLLLRVIDLEPHNLFLCCNLLCHTRVPHTMHLQVCNTPLQQYLSCGLTALT
jgi:hypothetical protein